MRESNNSTAFELGEGCMDDSSARDSMAALEALLNIKRSAPAPSQANKPSSSGSIGQVIIPSCGNDVSNCRQLTHMKGHLQLEQYKNQSQQNFFVKNPSEASTVNTSAVVPRQEPASVLNGTVDTKSSTSNSYIDHAVNRPIDSTPNPITNMNSCFENNTRTTSCSFGNSQALSSAQQPSHQHHATHSQSQKPVLNHSHTAPSPTSHQMHSDVNPSSLSLHQFAAATAQGSMTNPIETDLQNNSDSGHQHKNQQHRHHQYSQQMFQSSHHQSMILPLPMHPNILSMLSHIHVPNALQNPVVPLPTTNSTSASTSNVGYINKPTPNQPELSQPAPSISSPLQPNSHGFDRSRAPPPYSIYNANSLNSANLSQSNSLSAATKNVTGTPSNLVRKQDIVSTKTTATEVTDDQRNPLISSEYDSSQATDPISNSNASVFSASEKSLTSDNKMVPPKERKKVSSGKNSYDAKHTLRQNYLTSMQQQELQQYNNQEHHHITQQQHHRNEQVFPTCSSSSSKKEEELNPLTSIRTDEVEAALRSKPQRGKKRDNLNSLERLELTRTRNREHAKSTRIRKKARYEELIQNEKKYLDMKPKQTLDISRRQCVQKFMDLRTALLRMKSEDYNSGSATDSNNSCWNFSLDVTPGTTENRSSSGTPITPSVNAAGMSSSPEPTSACSGKEDQKDFLNERKVRVISFSDFPKDPAIPPAQSTSSAPSPNCDSVKSASMLYQDVIDVSSFKFLTPPFSHHQNSASSTVSSISKIAQVSMSKLQSYDTDIAYQVKMKLGNDAVSLLEFRIVNSIDGVALTPGNNGFAEFELVYKKSEKQAILLLGGIVQFGFCLYGHKIESLCHIVTSTYIDFGRSSSSGVLSHLGEQTAFPSVVSLDQNCLPSSSSNNLPFKSEDQDSETSPKSLVDTVTKNSIDNNLSESDKEVKGPSLGSIRLQQRINSSVWNGSSRGTTNDSVHSNLNSMNQSEMGNQSLSTCMDNNGGPGMNI